MYVGPWQEYRVMQALASLKSENERLLREHAQATALQRSGGGAFLTSAGTEPSEGTRGSIQSTRSAPTAYAAAKEMLYQTRQQRERRRAQPVPSGTTIRETGARPGSVGQQRARRHQLAELYMNEGTRPSASPSAARPPSNGSHRSGRSPVQQDLPVVGAVQDGPPNCGLLFDEAGIFASPTATASSRGGTGMGAASRQPPRESGPPESLGARRAQQSMLGGGSVIPQALTALMAQQQRHAPEPGRAGGGLPSGAVGAYPGPPALGAIGGARRYDVAPPIAPPALQSVPATVANAPPPGQPVSSLGAPSAATGRTAAAADALKARHNQQMLDLLARQRAEQEAIDRAAETVADPPPPAPTHPSFGIGLALPTPPQPATATGAMVHRTHRTPPPAVHPASVPTTPGIGTPPPAPQHHPFFPPGTPTDALDALRSTTNSSRGAPIASETSPLRHSRGSTRSGVGSRQSTVSGSLGLNRGALASPAGTISASAGGADDVADLLSWARNLNDGFDTPIVSPAARRRP